MATDRPDDTGALDEMGEKECWALLAEHSLGRLAVMDGGYPHIVPINYMLTGRTILFRSDSGTKLAAIHRSRVAFEIDGFDPVHHSGWSVVVQGVAQELTADSNPRFEKAATAAGLAPWAPGKRPYLVRVVADRISGRRVRPPEAPPPSGAPG